MPNPFTPRRARCPVGLFFVHTGRLTNGGEQMPSLRCTDDGQTFYQKDLQRQVQKDPRGRSKTPGHHRPGVPSRLWAYFPGSGRWIACTLEGAKKAIEEGREVAHGVRPPKRSGIASDPQNVARWLEFQQAITRDRNARHRSSHYPTNHDAITALRIREVQAATHPAREATECQPLAVYPQTR